MSGQQQFQLSAVGTVISVWRAAHNRFIKAAATRHSLVATGWQRSWYACDRKKKREGKKHADDAEERREKSDSREILLTRVFHLSIIVTRNVAASKDHRSGWKSWRTIRILMTRDGLRKSKKFCLRSVFFSFFFHIFDYTMLVFDPLLLKVSSIFRGTSSSLVHKRRSDIWRLRSFLWLLGCLPVINGTWDSHQRWNFSIVYPCSMKQF